MAEMNLGRVVHRFGYTQRKDAWWVKPLFTFIGLGSFVVYVTWRLSRESIIHRVLTYHRFIPRTLWRFTA
jgi:hypothetical protein